MGPALISRYFRTVSLPASRNCECGVNPLNAPTRGSRKCCASSNPSHPRRITEFSLEHAGTFGPSNFLLRLSNTTVGAPVGHPSTETEPYPQTTFFLGCFLWYSFCEKLVSHFRFMRIRLFRPELPLSVRRISSHHFPHLPELKQICRIGGRVNLLLS